MGSLDKVLDYLDADQQGALDRLVELLKFKSISTDPAFAEETAGAAKWLADCLSDLGFDAAERPTTGHPMVVGHWTKAGADAPHVLFYGHYDVQPVDPLALWQTPPFEPTLKTVSDGRQVLVGRGTADDKGQLMTFLEAARAWIHETGALPVNVTVFLEGEEESGSPSLLPFLAENQDELACDIALVCDTNMHDPDTPAITASLRGMVSQEVTIKAADRDLHSGYYGGPARNPLHVLSQILADLHDETGRVMIEGFYEGVHETPTATKAEWETLGTTAATFLGPVGLSKPAGEAGRSVLEQIWARPTCEVNGIWGGYIGTGFKTVIPAEASAKISFRLVHDQDPEKCHAAFVAFVEARLPEDCTATFIQYGGAPGSAIPVDRPEIQKARAALDAEWPNKAVVTGVGGSIPVVGAFKSELGMDSLLIGFGLADDAIHSPNEKYDLNSYRKGARSWARILSAISI